MRSKLLRVLLIVIGVTLVVDLFIVTFVDKNFFNDSGETSVANESVVAEFSQEKALEKLQSYKITKPLHSPEIEAGKTIADVYLIKGEIPAVKNMGWFSDKTENEGVFVVGYRQSISGSLQEPRWEVGETYIKALNGKAITITPEFGPESWPENQ